MTRVTLKDILDFFEYTKEHKEEVNDLISTLEPEGIREAMDHPLMRGYPEAATRGWKPATQDDLIRYVFVSGFMVGFVAGQRHLELKELEQWLSLEKV